MPLDNENNKNDNNVKPFVRAKDRANEYKSSAYALLIVGVLGMIFLILSLFGIINIVNINPKSIGFIAMLIMFLIFIIVGVKSFVESKTIAELSDAEDDVLNSIEEYFNNNCSAESIDKLALSDEDEFLSEELKFFKREEVIRNILNDNFKDADNALLEDQVEKIYNKLFD